MTYSYDFGDDIDMYIQGTLNNQYIENKLL